MCSKREGSEAGHSRNAAPLGVYSVPVRAAYPAGQPRARPAVQQAEAPEHRAAPHREGQDVAEDERLAGNLAGGMAIEDGALRCG